MTPEVSRVEKLSVTEPAITMVLSVMIGGEVGLIQTRGGVRHVGLQVQDTFVGKGFAQLARFGVDANRRPSFTGITRRGQSAMTSGLALSARASW
jgi:hypothetical protein